MPWGVLFPDPRAGNLPRHPSQLYEAGLEGLVLFTILWLYSAKPRPAGTVSGLFLAFYGIFRFTVEFVRVPDAQLGYLLFGWMTMGQILSLPMVLPGPRFSRRPAESRSNAARLAPSPLWPGPEARNPRRRPRPGLRPYGTKDFPLAFSTVSTAGRGACRRQTPHSWANTSSGGHYRSWAAMGPFNSGTPCIGLHGTSFETKGSGETEESADAPLPGG